MSDLTLIVGNKNYSSWSLRAWLALKYTGAPFQEIRLPLGTPEFRATLARYSPAGKVPALVHGAVRVWDSLAICEYLAEAFPAAKLWPADTGARALARAICAEMHAGFPALRQNMPMNLRRAIPGRALAADTGADIARVSAIWNDCRRRYGAAGPLLFGRFTIADAMYAPVALRFVTYRVPLDPVAQAYVDAVCALPATQEWIAAARAEAETLPQFEVAD